MDRSFLIRHICDICLFVMFKLIFDVQARMELHWIYFWHLHWTRYWFTILAAVLVISNMNLRITQKKYSYWYILTLMGKHFALIFLHVV